MAIQLAGVTTSNVAVVTASGAVLVAGFDGASNFTIPLASGGGSVVVSGSVAIQSNASVNVAQINGVTPLMGNGITGTGSQRVTIASDNTAFSVNATLSAETTKVIGTVNVAASQTIAVTNTGTFATQSTLSAETTKVIGTVNVAASQTIAVTNTGTFATQSRPASPTTATWSQAVINFSASGDNTLVAGVLGQTIRVMRIFFVNSDAATATNVTFKDSTPTSLSGAFRLSSGGSFSGDSNGEPLFVTASGKGLVLNSSGAVQISGTIYFTQS